MKSHVAIYNTHAKALEAISLLSEKGFPMEHVSLVGKRGMVADHFEVKSFEHIKYELLASFTTLGLILGLLAGKGIIVVPGFFSLVDSGLMIGAFVGLDLGLILGAMAMMLAAVAFKEHYLKSDNRRVENKYMVIVNGSKEEVEMAKLLFAHGGRAFNDKYANKGSRENRNLSLSMA